MTTGLAKILKLKLTQNLVQKKLTQNSISIQKNIKCIGLFQVLSIYYGVKYVFCVSKDIKFYF
jgi:hypothetical protein